jgi:hypothetical protein
MKDEHIKALFIFTAGFLLFWVVKPKFKKTNNDKANLTTDADNPKDREKLDSPTMSAKDAKKNPKAANAFAALKAYIAAYNNKEPQSVLDELNRELAKEFKVKVYKRKSDGKLVVCDLDGKEVIVNN